MTAVTPFHRTLQLLVLVCGCVPVAAGAAGIFLGPPMAGGTAISIGLDSHFSYLSGLLLAIGLGFWSLVPNLQRNGASFRLLTALVFVGGLARLSDLLTDGPPPAPMLFGLAMELLVTPTLCFLQARL